MFSITARLGEKLISFVNNSSEVHKKNDEEIYIKIGEQPWNTHKVWIRYDWHTGDYFVRFVDSHGVERTHILGVQTP